MGKIVVHNKLIRDKIPDIIRLDGHEPVVRVLDEQERLPAALAKVVEEANELRDSNGDLYEFADVLSIVKAAAVAKGYTIEQIEQAETEKAAKRGGFDEWLFLEKVDEG